MIDHQRDCVSRATKRALSLFVGMSALLGATGALAAPPTATGSSAFVALTGEEINLRSQGVIAGTPALTVSAPTVPGQPLITATVTNGVCVLISNPQGIDYAAVGAQLQVTVSNVDAPSGVTLSIPLLAGTGFNDLAACADANAAPSASAGLPQTLPDTDGVPGENVLLDGSESSDPVGTIVSYTWTDLTSGQALGTSASPTLTTRLADGVRQVQLTVTDDSGATATDQVTITVQAPAGPTANAGPDQNIGDSDGVPAEQVTLDGAASTAGASAITTYQWSEGQQILGAGPTLQVRLDDGAHTITLTVTDANNLTATDTVVITVGAGPPRGALASLANLKPNQRSLAAALDDLCFRLAQSQTPSDLLDRCNGIVFDPNAANQVEALEQLSAEDYNAIQTQTLFFANTQTTGVMERLMALRSGASGLSLSGLALTIDGKLIPAAQLAMLAEQAADMLGLSGGESASEEAPGSLLGDKLGVWLRGNYGNLDKDESTAGHAFSSDQWGFTAGLDYRFTRSFVAGVSVGYGEAALDYAGGARGNLDTDSWTASVYASAYLVDNLYLDGVFNYGQNSYDSQRHIVYNEDMTLIDRTASGQTDGDTLSGALALGYDLQVGGLTISPNVSYLYTSASVDALTEDGAGGLDLIIDERDFDASTGTAGLRVAYAAKFGWGVLLPHFRGDFVREFQSEAEVFGVRFADDPFADSSNPTPPIVVYSDNPDQSYWKFTVGTSAQFKHGVSAYVEYQRLEAFEFVSFDDFTVGLRLQQGF